MPKVRKIPYQGRIKLMPYDRTAHVIDRKRYKKLLSYHRCGAGYIYRPGFTRKGSTDKYGTYRHGAYVRDSCRKNPGRRRRRVAA